MDSLQLETRLDRLRAQRAAELEEPESASESEQEERDEREFERAPRRWQFCHESLWRTPLPVQVEAEARLNEPGVAELSGIVSLPCAAGKTRIVLDVALREQRVLFLSYETAGVAQFYDSISKHTNVPRENVFVFSGESKHPVILGPTCFLSTSYCMIANGHSSLSCASQKVISRIYQCKWDLLVCDECHHCPAPAFRKGIERLLRNTKRVIGLTATLIRTLTPCDEQRYAALDASEQQTVMQQHFSFLGPVLFQRSWREMEAGKMIAKTHFFTVSTPMSERERKAFELSVGLSKAYVGNLTASKLNAVFNITKLHGLRKQVGIVFCDHVFPAQMVASMLGEGWVLMRGEADKDLYAADAEDASSTAGTAMTSTKQRMCIRDRINAGDTSIKGIVATRVADAALDIASQRFVYAIAVDQSRSKATNAQRAGRVMRNDASAAVQKTAYFYDLVTPDTADTKRGELRRTFVEEQGYKYKMRDESFFVEVMDKVRKDNVADPMCQIGPYDPRHEHFKGKSLQLLHDTLLVTERARASRDGSKLLHDYRTRQMEMRQEVRQRAEAAHSVFKSKYKRKLVDLSRQTVESRKACKQMKRNAIDKAREEPVVTNVFLTLHELGHVTTEQLETVGISVPAAEV